MVDVPAGASVEQVLLYWHGLTDGNTAPATDNITVNGMVTTGDLIGTLDSFPGVLEPTYRSDITGFGLVNAGTTNLTIAGLDFSRRNDGAGVIVIFDDGSGSADIELRDGQDFAWDGSSTVQERETVAQTFNFTPAGVARTATLPVLVASVEAPRETSVEVTVDGTTTTFSNLFNDNVGPEFDAHNISFPVPANATSLTIQLFSRDDDPVAPPNDPASLNWMAGGIALKIPPMVCTGVIGDFIWNDLNRDGLQDAGEPGISGVTRILRDVDGNEITRTTSDNTGFYSFNELCAGTYFVDLDETTVPDGFEMTQIEVGGDPTIDSNDLTKPVILTTDDSEDLTIDCGFVPPQGGGEGCTPGYWRQTQHFDSWVGFAPSDSFAAVFGRAITVKSSPGGGKPQTVSNPTLLDAVWASGGGINALARHAVAALLNAANPNVNYAIVTPGEVITAFQSAFDSGDLEPTKDLFANANEAGCTLN